MTKEELWQTALGEVELTISKASYSAWLSQAKIDSWEKKKVIVSVPNNFVREWLENKYNKLILRGLRNVSSEIKEVEYIISSSVPSFVPAKTVIRAKEQLGFENFKTNKETNLNPKYTFESFVVGSSNELAHAAALAVAENLGKTYNPLFIYGGVGLGKTHLIQAIGNEVIENNHKKVKYVTSEKFTSEVVSCIKNHKMEDFKEKYRKVDLLIIDDIQFLTGKEKTQEEFFHTFNALYEKNKQIVLSSDRPPKAISTLEERLRSRFEGGMIADISYPELETRLAILSKKLEEKNINLPDEVLEYVASNIQKNIRELEGALNRIMIFMKVNKEIPTVGNISKVLASIISSPKKVVSPNQIIKTVCDFYDIPIKELTCRNRKREIVKPRQVAMYLMREEIKNSFPFIGEKLGGRDHTTVMYAVEKIKNDIEKNEGLSQEINLIKERIYS